MQGHNLGITGAAACEYRKQINVPAFSDKSLKPYLPASATQRYTRINAGDWVARWGSVATDAARLSRNQKEPISSATRVSGNTSTLHFHRDKKQTDTTNAEAVTPD